MEKEGSTTLGQLAIVLKKSHKNLRVFFPEEKSYIITTYKLYIIGHLFKNCGSFIFAVSLEKLPQMVDCHHCSSFPAQEVLLRGPGHVHPLPCFAAMVWLYVDQASLLTSLKGQEVQAVWVFGGIHLTSKRPKPMSRIEMLSSLRRVNRSHHFCYHKVVVTNHVLTGCLAQSVVWTCRDRSVVTMSPSFLKCLPPRLF